MYLITFQCYHICVDSEHSNPSPKLHCKLHHHLLQGTQGTSAWKCRHVSPWLSVERKYLLEPKEKEGSSTIYGQGVMVKGFQFLTDSNSRRLSQRFGGCRPSLVRFFFFGVASPSVYDLLTEQLLPFLVPGIVFCKGTGIRYRHHWVRLCRAVYF